jgi:FKBP-type peptidyl-prolyl cis-trans isomerase FklB
MKKHILAKLAVCCLALQMGGEAKALAAAGALKTEPQQIGYALGVSLGNSFKIRKVTLDADFLGKGAKAQLTGAASLMTAGEVKAVLAAQPGAGGPSRSGGVLSGDDLKAALAAMLGGPTNPPPVSKKFKNAQEQTGYAFGVDFAQRLQASGLGAADLDLDDAVKGVKDMVAGKTLLLTTNELTVVFADVQAKIQEKQAALQAKQIEQRKAQDPKFKAESEKNLKEGAEFLAKNKTAPGVKSLPNGLQYSVITAGTGPIPKPTDSVKVNYRGLFLNGAQFDASPPGVPLSCGLSGGLIQGWLDILKLMPAGSKWKVFIPSGLAYGERGYPPAIPPNATLVFEMELVSIDSGR